jgi:G2/mitotic-specific cyclin 2
MTWDMRAKLISWMMEVGAEFALRRETIHNSVISIDRYLGRVAGFPKSKLQLLAISALFMSSKMEEVVSPTCANFAYTAGNCYSDEEILDMER